MDDDQQQFDKDDYTGLDGQNGENFEQQENTEQAVEDGGDQAMETGGDQAEEDGNEDDRYSVTALFCDIFAVVTCVIVVLCAFEVLCNPEFVVELGRLYDFIVWNAGCKTRWPTTCYDLISSSPFGSFHSR